MYSATFIGLWCIANDYPKHTLVLMAWSLPWWATQTACVHAQIRVNVLESKMLIPRHIRFYRSCIIMCFSIEMNLYRYCIITQVFSERIWGIQHSTEFVQERARGRVKIMWISCKHYYNYGCPKWGKLNILLLNLCNLKAEHQICIT